MERKSCFRLFFLILCFFLCITSVKAKECTTEEIRELKQLAKKIEFSYVLDEKTTFFELFGYNLSDKFYLESSEIGYIKFEKKIQSLGRYTNGFSDTVYVYASQKTNCFESQLYQIKISIPFYNKYSANKECSDYREFDLCKKWFDSSDISEPEFKKEFQQYKESLIQEKNVFFANLLNFVKTNYVYIIAICFSVFVIVLAYIGIKRRNKTKINFEVR